MKNISVNPVLLQLYLFSHMQTTRTVGRMSSRIFWDLKYQSMVSNITQPTQISNIYTHILIKNTFISICTICLLPSGGKCRVIRIDLETTVSVQGTTVKNGTFTRKNLTLSLLIRRRKRGYDSLKCKAVANCFHFAAARLEWTWKMK